MKTTLFRRHALQLIGCASVATLAAGCGTVEGADVLGEAEASSELYGVPETASQQLTAGAALDFFLRFALWRADVDPVEPPPPQDPALVELGQALFFDREISGPRNIACATCHNPLVGSGDGQSQSRAQGAVGLGPARGTDGVVSAIDGARIFVEGGSVPFFEFLPRNALSLWNRGVPGWDVMFWDGRLSGNSEDGFLAPAGSDTPQDVANALALFGIFPITPDQEMRGFPGQPDIFGNENELAALGIGNGDFVQIWDLIVARIASNPGYDELLAAAFPGSSEFTISNFGDALGAFQTEAFTALDTPFDRYLAGENSAMSDAAKRGALLFYGRANCSNCHSGGLTTDLEFHNIAGPQVGTGRPATTPLDIGRAETTGDPNDRFKFRTPALRNVALEGPWFHNGAYADLEDAVRHHLDPAAALASYDDSQVEPELAGTFMPELNGELLETLDPALAVAGPLSDRDVRNLMAFLSALTDPASLNMFDVIPASVPSGLPVAD